MDRVIAYIDGLNLYYGIKESQWKKYYWLNLVKLVRQFLPANQTLLKVKYFTSCVSSSDPSKSLRQMTFFNALTYTCGQDLEIIKGNFLKKEVRCTTHRQLSGKSGFSPCKQYSGRNCDGTFIIHEEKKTDVNIATSLLVDAFTNLYDIAYLVSGDTDLIPPVKVIASPPLNKNIVVLFPPRRASDEIKNLLEVSKSSQIKESHLQLSLLPDRIVVPRSGAILFKPPQWN